MKRFSLIIIFILFFGITLAACAFEYGYTSTGYKYVKHEHSESSYQHAWCSAHNGIEEFENKDFTRVDCLTDKYAVEFDFANKWAESIGQALHYQLMTGKKAKVGTKIIFGDGMLVGEVVDIVEEGNRLIQFHYEGIFEEILDKLGQMPLPPYITHQLQDKNRYQTVYAKHDGSAAAPTAGLHFTPELLQQVRDKGVEIAEVTLHVGLGTFRPVKEDNLLNHHMHSEFYNIDQSEADKINKAKAEGHRVISVGTTSTRTLESAALEDGSLKACSGWTEIFIYPGYKFKVIDALITNFHLPESTLVMLVSALAGREHVLAAYKQAVDERYRFFSFGDAMFIHAK